MKIAVLMKRVPDTASVFKIGSDNKSVDTAGLKYVISPYDEHAIEEAIKLREGGKAEEVIIVTAGPEGSQETIRTALAMGADGWPVISHFQGVTDALRVTKCGNPACSANNVSSTVDDPPGISVGFYTSIGVGPDGLPAISHLDLTNFDLRFTKCGTQACR